MMKKFYLITLLLIGISSLVFSQEDEGLDKTSFITVWKTDNSGKTNNTSLGIGRNGCKIDIDIDNDGHFEYRNVNKYIIHDFGVPGEYTIRIRGLLIPENCSEISPGNQNKLIEVKQWGDIEINNYEYLFAYCENFKITAKDAPNLSKVTSLKKMFYKATNFEGNIGHWDVSDVVDMSFMFYEAKKFNGDISDWYPVRARIMSYMFYKAESFNQDISKWPFLCIKDAAYMFYEAKSFNQDISGWEPVTITNMSNMFCGAESFNQDLSSWWPGKCDSFKNFLDGTAMSCENYEKLLIEWSGSRLQYDVIFDANNIKYKSSFSKQCRDILIKRKGWTINDGGRLISKSTPSASNINIINMNAGRARIIPYESFKYSDPDGNPMDHILIESEPSDASIWMDLNNNNILDKNEASIKKGDIILTEYIKEKKLKCKVIYDLTKDSFTFRVNNQPNYSEEIYACNIWPDLKMQLSTEKNAYNESVGKFNVTIKRENFISELQDDISLDLIFSGTAKKGIDYTVDDTPVLLKGQKEAVFTITVINNQVDEKDKSIEIKLKEFPYAKLDIQITDDDYSPVITANQVFEVSENVSMKKELGSIAVTHGNEASVFKDFRIKKGNEKGIFNLDSENGKLSLVKPHSLNFDRRKFYTLTITVSDGINTSNETNITINVLDFNHTPNLMFNHGYSIVENAEEGEYIGFVNASDKDANDKLTYMIIKGNEENIFNLNSENGKLTLAKPELINYDNKQSYTLTVTASDGVNTSEEADISINVLDFNYTPEIVAEQVFEISENATQDNLIGAILASDKDADDKLTYMIIKGNEENIFNLNSENGKLTLAKPELINYDNKQSYTLTITASDGVNTSKEADININVLDFNYIPEIVAEQVFEINSNIKNNTIIGKIKVNDKNTDAVFSDWKIVSGNDDNAFDINSKGELIVKDNSKFKSKTTPEYKLSVTVSDGTNTSNEEVLTVKILNALYLYESSQNSFISLVPNPTKNNFSLQTNAANYPLNIQIIDNKGIVLMQKTQRALNDKITINLKPGLYFVKTCIKGKAVSKKLIVE
ncbi:MAG: BspA family leucine-rich repeat surface protein [Hyphomicrobiales bacterium]